jgi:CxxC-x17-CxxC domain-containing protein
VAFQDQNLQCRDCGKDFVWTASEQEFYQEKGFTNAPVRCPDCRRIHKQQRQGGGGGGGGGGFNRGPRQMFEVQCANCGKQTTVPFQPKGDRPVYCRECFDAKRDEPAQ